MSSLFQDNLVMRLIVNVSRKTGITVPDSGIRDEHGLETTDHLFSSPAKSRAPNSGRKEYADATLSSDEMDEVDSIYHNHIDKLRS